MIGRPEFLTGGPYVLIEHPDRVLERLADAQCRLMRYQMY
jgi:hypothetical protein